MADIYSTAPPGLEERLTPDSCEGLARMLASQSGINVIASDRFAYDDATNSFLYNRSQLLTMTHEQAAGLLIHNMGHAQFSRLKKRPLSARLRDMAANGTIGLSTARMLYEAMEDERSEGFMAEELRNMRNADLPLVSEGYRKPYFDKMREQLATPSEAGEMNPVTNQPIYYERAATALRGLINGAFTKDDLPPDMLWNDKLIQSIESMRAEINADKAATQFSDVLNQIIDHRQKEEPPPEEPPNDGEGDGPPQDGEEGDSQGKPGDPGDKQGKSKPSQPEQGQGKPSAPTPEQRKAEQSRAEVDDNSDDIMGPAPGIEIDKSAPTDTSPAWVLVKQLQQSAIRRVLKFLTQHLKDNQMSDIERGHKTGRFNAREYVKLMNANSPTYYDRRSELGEKSYAVGLLVDRSGSMAGSRSSILSYPEIFATGGNLTAQFARAFNPDGSRKGGGSVHEMALRMAVTFVEAFANFKEVQVSVAGFQGSLTMFKDFKENLSPRKRTEIMRYLNTPRGGTCLGVALMDYLPYFERAKVDKKMLIVLTDGGIEASDVADCQKFTDAGIELVVLNILANEAVVEFVGSVVGEQNSDSVDDDNIATVFGKHLRRMIAGGKSRTKKKAIA